MHRLSALGRAETVTEPSPIRSLQRYGWALSFGFPSGKDSCTVKSRLLALASAALVLAAVAAPAAQAATSVVISQVAFGGTGGGNDEVIEIRNVSAATVDIGGWELWALQQQRRHGERARHRAGGHDAARGQDVRVRQHGRHVHRPGRRHLRHGHRDHRRHRDPQRRRRHRMHGRVRRDRRCRCPTARARASPSRPAAADGFVRKNGGTQDTDDNVADFTGPTTPTPTKCGTDCTGTAPPDAVRGPAATAPCRSRASRRSTPTRRVRRQDGDGPRHRHRHRRPLRLELRRVYQGRLGHLGAERHARPAGDDVERAVRRRASPARRTRRPYVGRDITITGRSQTQFGLVQLVPPGVGSISSPTRQQVASPTSPTNNGEGNAAAGPGRARQDRVRDPGRGHPPVLPQPAGHARDAARRHRHRRRHDASSATCSSSRAPTPSACSARTTRRRSTRRGRTRPPRSASRPTAAPATRPTRA